MKINEAVDFNQDNSTYALFETYNPILKHVTLELYRNGNTSALVTSNGRETEIAFHEGNSLKGKKLTFNASDKEAINSALEGFKKEKNKSKMVQAFLNISTIGWSVVVGGMLGWAIGFFVNVLNRVEDPARLLKFGIIEDKFSFGKMFKEMGRDIFGASTYSLDNIAPPLIQTIQF